MTVYERKRRKVFLNVRILPYGPFRRHHLTFDIWWVSQFSIFAKSPQIVKFVTHRSSSIVRSTHWTICNLLNTRSSALHANYGIVHLDLFELLSRILFWHWQSSPLKYVHIVQESRFAVLQVFQYFESTAMGSWAQKGSVLNIYCWWTLKKIMFHCTFFSWILVLKMRTNEKETQVQNNWEY